MWCPSWCRRGGKRGFPHWALWQQRNTAFGADLVAYMLEGGRVRLGGGCCWQAGGRAGLQMSVQTEPSVQRSPKS
jgi:hypothetical protein